MHVQYKQTKQQTVSENTSFHTIPSQLKES